MDCTVEQVEKALVYISPDEARDDWVLVGMALKNEFGAAGFGMFDRWSQGSDKYKAADVKSTWKSIKAGGGTGIGTLFKKAKDAGFDLKTEQREPEAERRYRQELAERKAQREKDFAEEQAWRERMAAVVAKASKELISELASHDAAPCQYLEDKQVRAFGVYVAARSVLMVVDDKNECYQLLTGEASIKAFFSSGAAKFEHISVRNIKRGCLVIPLVDGQDFCNVQIIFPNKKSFPRHGRKSGAFHMIGFDECIPAVICIGEGYATMASVYMATGYPCIVGFDAGNLVAISKLLRQWWPDSVLVFCGDNDTATDGNPGLTKARQAAANCGGIAVVPDFNSCGQEVVNG
jgi:putative DNA primase/helicase